MLQHSHTLEHSPAVAVRGVRRLAVLVMLLLQMATPGLHVYDALLEAEETAIPLHIESESSDACADPHSDALCQLVRALTHVTGDAPIARTVAAKVIHVGELPQSDAPHIDRILSGTRGSRAPPLA